MAKNTFSLFQSHLDLAHHYWDQLLQVGDTAVDATCGNGHDSLVLAELALSRDSGSLYAIDIQKRALMKTRELLETRLSPGARERVQYVHGSHETFPACLEDQNVKLIVYNLGYLPGGDKSLTTLSDTTVESLTSALDLIADGGAVSITCYPGHPEGKTEKEKIYRLLEKLTPKKWSVAVHQWINRESAPELILVQKNQQER